MTSASIPVPSAIPPAQGRKTVALVTERKRPAETDQFLARAKQLVVDNYNSHHDKSRTPPLTVDLVYVIWSAKVDGNWRVMLGSTVLNGLIYDVTYTGHRSRAHIAVYKKINNATINDTKD